MPDGRPLTDEEQSASAYAAEESHKNRRRKPDPVRTIIVASAVTLALGAITWAAATTASTLSAHEAKLSSHEAKWEVLDTKVNYLVDGMKDMRQNANDAHQVVVDVQDSAKALHEIVMVLQANQAKLPAAAKTKPR